MSQIQYKNTISINKRNLINFKKEFYHGEKLDNYPYASLAYDEENKIITFCFSNLKQKKFSYKILHRKTSGLIFASSFYRRFLSNDNFKIYTPTVNRAKNNRKSYSIKL